jgi:hypothetical protein
VIHTKFPFGVQALSLAVFKKFNTSSFEWNILWIIFNFAPFFSSNSFNTLQSIFSTAFLKYSLNLFNHSGVSKSIPKLSLTICKISPSLNCRRFLRSFLENLISFQLTVIGSQYISFKILVKSSFINKVFISFEISHTFGILLSKLFLFMMV